MGDCIINPATCMSHYLIAKYTYAINTPALVHSAGSQGTATAKNIFAQINRFNPVM